MAATEKEILWKLENFRLLPEFLHECVNDLCKQNTSNFGKNTSGDIELTQEELKRARVKIQNCFRQNAMDDTFSPTDLPENLKNAFTYVYKIRHKDILNLIIKENLVNSGHNLVENIDWKLKWVLGSSKLASIREPICQVDLRCASAEKDLTTLKKDIYFEVNLDKLDDLISVLNNVKDELDGLQNKV